jgi:hypothetical protein
MYFATKPPKRCTVSALLTSGNHLAEIFGVDAARQRRRTNEV